MRRLITHARWLTVALLAAGCLVVGSAASVTAQEPVRTHACRGEYGCRPYQYGQPDLFYNYYVPPTCGGVGTQMYVSPGPVPAHVGHTYYTYQPLMPHEFLYPHHRTYHKTYDDGRGLTRTSVHWYSPPGKATLSHVHSMLRIAR